MTRRADGGATAAEATLKGLRAKQVGGFQVTRLPAKQREFPESTPGYLGNGFQVSAPADGAARLTFRLDPDRTEGTAPALYRYDEKARHLVKQSGQQRSGSTITATATADGSAKYVVLDSHAFDKAGPKAPGKRILSDGPGDGGDPGDPGDPPPTDMLIHQSSFREGRRKAPTPSSRPSRPTRASPTTSPSTTTTSTNSPTSAGSSGSPASRPSPGCGPSSTTS